MKVKVKNQIDDIRIKLTHRELVLLKEALYNYRILNEDIDDINF